MKYLIFILAFISVIAGGLFWKSYAKSKDTGITYLQGDEIPEPLNDPNWWIAQTTGEPGELSSEIRIIESTPLGEAKDLPDGSRLEADGTLIKPDGSFMKFEKNGDVILEDGSLRKAEELTPESLKKKVRESDLGKAREKRLTRREIRNQEREYKSKVRSQRKIQRQNRGNKKN